jgi:hypothetical protein
MRRGITIAAELLLLGALAGCAGGPGVAGDPAPPRFKADLKVCRASSEAQVEKQDGKRFVTWLISPVTSPGQTHRAVRACMEGKGYAAR